MAHRGKTQLLFVISVPAAHVAEGDRLFASHGPWMEATHHRDGDVALRSYNVSKAPELSNPMDATSEPTGNTLFILSEIYETPAGVQDHFAQAEASWADFPALMEWLSHCSITGAPVATIANSLW